MPNPESEKKKLGKDPYEILEKGREEMRNSPMKEMRKRLRYLEREQKILEKEYNFYASAKFENLDEEGAEAVRQKIKGISERLEKIETEHAKLDKDIQGMEDVIKAEMLEASKRLQEEK